MPLLLLFQVWASCTFFLKPTFHLWVRVKINNEKITAFVVCKVNFLYIQLQKLKSCGPAFINLLLIFFSINYYTVFLIKYLTILFIEVQIFSVHSYFTIHVMIPWQQHLSSTWTSPAQSRDHGAQNAVGGCVEVTCKKFSYAKSTLGFLCLIGDLRALIN